MKDVRGVWRSLAVVTACLTGGCVYEFSEPVARPRGSAGEEVYQLLCQRLAAHAFPNDLTGEQFDGPCARGDRATVQAIAQRAPHDAHDLARLDALLARRAALVDALDAILETEALQDGELRGFLLELLPFYDPPSPLLPGVTAATAKLLADLIDTSAPASDEALNAMARVAKREGYRPLRLSLGVVRPLLAYPNLDELVASTLKAIDPAEGAAGEAWRELLKAAALDLATAEPTEEGEESTLAVTRRLLFRQDPAFSGGDGPLLVARRDRRGYALGADDGSGGVPAPFMDADGDGLADLTEDGRFVTSLPDGVALMPPFPTLSRALAGMDQGARDDLGRALNPLQQDSLLYDYLDADRTLVAGVTRDLGPLLVPEGGPSALTTAAVQNFAYGLSALLGDWGEREADMGGRALRFVGPDTDTGVLFELVWALGQLLHHDETDDLLGVVEALVRDHERELAALIEAGLYIDERADAYPDARWEAPHDFWDDLLAWARRVLQRPGMLEAMLRSMTTDEFARGGALIGNFMRFRDRVTYPQGKREELEAAGIDMTQVLGNLGDDNVANAVQEHRRNVNAPCERPPTGIVGGSVGDPGCVPNAGLPAPHHRGIRSCPDSAPTDGASCADMTGFGVCSYDSGSCVCDCQGGLCRGDASPTWRCGLPPTRGYAEWVDRSQPDLRVGADGQTNQSLFQRTAALIHDLHGPAKLCNKEGARMKVYTPAGSNSGLSLGPLDGLLGLGPYGECELLHETQIVQLFVHSILGKAKLKLNLSSVVSLISRIGGTVDTLMERQTQLRGLVVNGPTPQAISRLVFSPFNSFQAGLLDLPQTRDRVDIVDVHRDTIFAWEVADPISGVNMYQALRPLLDAMDTHELRDGNGQLVDGYLFGDLMSIIHRHWSSRHDEGGDGSLELTRRCLADNGDLPDSVCVLDDSVPHNSYQSNGVSYEELVAEALVDARLLERIKDVMVALDGIEVAPGVDGISLLVSVTRKLIEPQWSCDGDCESAPLRTRGGQTTTATNTGRPLAQLSPAYLLLDSLNAIDRRFESPENNARLAPWRQARSALVDQLLDVAHGDDGGAHFKNPRSKALLLHTLDFVRERLAFYRGEQDACKAAGGQGCRQLRDWAEGLSERMARSLGQPITAATLRLLDQFWGAPDDPGGELLGLVHWLAQEPTVARAFDTSLLAAVDALQVLDDDRNLVPIMHYMATALAPNIQRAAADPNEDPDITQGTVEKILELLRQIQRVSPGSADAPSPLTKLVRAAASEHGPSGESPLEVILDTIAEVNRAAPGADAGRALTADDLRAVLHQTERFLADERYGLERLYDVVRSRTPQ